MSIALNTRLLALRRRAVEAREPVAMSRNPAVNAVFEPVGGRKGIEHGEQRPHAAQLAEDAIDGLRAREFAPGWLDNPRLAVYGLAGEAVLLKHIRSLVREGQHPASRITRANPVRGAGSEASVTVEEEKESLGGHGSR